ELGGHAIPPSPRIQITQKITHPGMYMPQNPELLATKAVMGEVLVFDRTKHASEPEPDIRKNVLSPQPLKAALRPPRAF
ncbi:hypothetical protein FB446DRAFT_651312, partial [Lentinula raphanica]